MKLCEIRHINGPVDEPIVDDYPDMVSPAHKKHIDNIKKNPKVTPVGTGANAFVYKQDDPQLVDRVFRSAPIEDAGTYYLNRVYHSPLMKTNPYLPRVIEIPSRAKNKLPTYQVEQLAPLKTPVLLENKELWRSFLFKCFKNYDWLEKLKKAIDEGDEDKVDSIERYNDLSDSPRFSSAYYYCVKIVALIRTALYHNDLETIKDPKLRQALHFITEVEQDLREEIADNDNGYETKLDIHPGNIMIRLSGQGAQLVIIDPIHTMR